MKNTEKMKFVVTNAAHYKRFRGKLAHMLEEVTAKPEEKAEERQVWVKIPQGSVVMILDINIEKPPFHLDGRRVNEESYLHWITFQADFYYRVLYEDRVLNFVGKKMSLVPKTN